MQYKVMQTVNSKIQSKNILQLLYYMIILLNMNVKFLLLFYIVF